MSVLVSGGVGASQMAHVMCSVLNAKDYFILFPEQGSRYNFTLAIMLCVWYWVLGIRSIDTSQALLWQSRRYYMESQSLALATVLLFR